MSESPTAIDIAYGLLREGRLVDAEQLMLKELQRHKPGTPEWASAQCDVGNLLFASSQFDRAVEYFRNACADPPGRDAAGYRDYLTYRMNLGSGLAAAGRSAEAESELRRNLEERLGFYGPEHPGYAFCLEQLAGVLFRRGDLAQAGRLSWDAVVI